MCMCSTESGIRQRLSVGSKTYPQRSCVLLSPAAWNSAPVLNGVQPAKHQNGLSPNGDSADFDDIIQMSNHSGGGNVGTDKPANSNTILAFDEGDPFLMKGGAMKTHHVTGTSHSSNSLQLSM